MCPARSTARETGCVYRESKSERIDDEVRPRERANLDAGSLYRSRNRRIFMQRSMRSDAVVQRGLRTPTGPFFARFFIGIILGLVAEFAFIVPSTRMVLSSSAARWKRRKQIGRLKCRPGCSTGRHVLTPGFWQLNRMSASRHLRRSPRCSIWR